jgi:hypothetical protein
VKELERRTPPQDLNLALENVAIKEVPAKSYSAARRVG